MHAHIHALQLHIFPSYVCYSYHEHALIFLYELVETQTTNQRQCDHGLWPEAVVGQQYALTHSSSFWLTVIRDVQFLLFGTKDPVTLYFSLVYLWQICSHFYHFAGLIRSQILAISKFSHFSNILARKNSKLHSDQRKKACCVHYLLWKIFRKFNFHSRLDLYDNILTLKISRFTEHHSRSKW